MDGRSETIATKGHQSQASQRVDHDVERCRQSQKSLDVGNACPRR